MSNSDPWLSGEEQRVWRAFVRMQQRLFATLARDLHVHSKLSGADFEILVTLTDVPDGRLRFQEIANTVEWEKSRLSHQITRMAKRGLVDKEECAEDARGAFVVITTAGRDAIDSAAPQHVALVRRLVVDTLSPDELATLAQISQRILDRIDRASP